MYHKQPFSSAGYRGGQEMNAEQARAHGSPVVSQYKGMTPRFEPTGTVPSFYDPQKIGKGIQAPQREQPLKQIRHGLGPAPFAAAQPIRHSPQPGPMRHAQPYGQTAANPTVSSAWGSPILPAGRPWN